MSNPSDLGKASLIFGIGSAISSTIGSYFSSATQKINLEAQAYIAEVNARMAEQSAQSALMQGNQQIAALTLKAGQIKSGQRAAMAANGVDLGVGSAAEIQASTDIMKDIDKNTTLSNTVRNAWAIRNQAMNYQNEALSKRATASAISPGASMFATMLTGAGSIASQWYNLNKEGVFDTPSTSNTGGEFLGQGIRPSAGSGINISFPGMR